MKNVLVLLFYMTGPIASTTKFLENVPPNPWFFTTQIQRNRPMRISKFPRFTTKDLPKLILWKHLLEMECLKDICSEVGSPDRSWHGRPFEVTTRAQVPTFIRKDKISHQDPNSYEIRGSRIRPEPQTNRYPGNDRIIFWTPEMTFSKNHVKIFPAKQELEPRKKPELDLGGVGPSMKFKEISKEPDDQEGQQKDNSEPSPFFQRRTMEEKDAVNPSGAFGEEEEGQRRRGPGADALSQIFHKPIRVKPTAPTYTPQAFRQEMNPSRIHPYEVEEIIEEKFQVDVDDNNDDGSFKAFAGENVVTKTEMNKKPENFQHIIDDSVKTILKGLMGPPKAPKENNSSTTKMFTSHLSPKKGSESVIGSPWNLHQTSTLEKIQSTPKPGQRPHGWQHKSAEARAKPDARVDSSRGFDLNPSFEKEYLNFLPTGPPRRPALTELDGRPFVNIFNVKDFDSDLAEGAAKKSMPESSQAAGTLKSLALLRDTDPQPNFASTEQKNANSTTDTVDNTTDRAAHSPPPSETSAPLKEMPAAESTTADSSDTVFNEANAATTPPDFPQTFRYSSDYDRADEENTESSSLEFSDRPLMFDLLTTTVTLDSKKDQEIVWKNSRRMHFGHEPLETTKGGTDQRRSDILITDNTADYVDDEIVSTLTYLEKLKQNNSHPPSPDANNSASDELIPFIPVIINDLREGKIPPEDIPILSGALGKYWKPVLTLSQFTNLDMLSLVNVKDEKDLQNVLHNYVPEEHTPTPAGTTEGDYRIDDYYSHSYDYMDEYKDLYKDILGQELGDKKRYRPRRDAEDDLKTLEATREYFESIEEEQNEDVGSDYVFEDLMYDEMSEGEDSSVFELMEVSDVHINKQT